VADVGRCLLAYLLVMSPWLVHNLNVIGSPLPTGGVKTAFLRGYDEIFAYPADWSARIPGLGARAISCSRAGRPCQQPRHVRRGRDLGVARPVRAGCPLEAPPRVVPGWILAVCAGAASDDDTGVCISRLPGGLFHSAAALLPFWAVLGTLGLDETITTVGRWRNWNVPQAKLVFGGALIVLAALLSGSPGWPRRATARARRITTPSPHICRLTPS